MPAFLAVLFLAAAFLVGASNRLYVPKDMSRITGDSPRDIASAIARMKAGLAPNRQVEFAQAVTTLTLVAPDKLDERSVGYMTPAFANMVRGRNVNEIIQLAVLYRTSAPMDRGGH